MFFPKLRRQAKWVFVLLALVFAGGFIFFGVGSGQGGLGDVLQGWIGRGGSNSGPSISKLEKETRQNPRDAQAFRDLGQAYAADQQTDKAIAALQRYSELRPRNAEALQELAAQYDLKLKAISTEAQSDPTLALTPPDQSVFLPPATTKIGQAYAAGTVLSDPISQALKRLSDSKTQDYQQRLQTVAEKQVTVYKRLVRLDPTDPGTQFQLARSAQYLGDTATAIAAYKQAKKLDPQAYGPYADQALKQLQPPAASQK